MTEDDAKQKWCPMVRLGDRDKTERTMCIGSDCMMWRKDGERYATGKDKIVDAGHGRKTIQKEYIEGGYCGLAGKP